MPRRLITMSITLVAFVFLFVACGSQQDEETPPMTKAARDSMLSESSLPGSATIKEALAVSDSAQARAARAAAVGK